MGKVIDFKKVENKVDNSENNMRDYSVPSIEEIELLKMAAIENSDEDGIIDMRLWDGECWKSFFEDACMFFAEQNGCDPWDVFAVFLTKFRGTKFNYENGELVSMTLE